MDQISLPYRIALVALLVVCALWFTVLQPKDPAVEPLPTAPGTTGLANDVSAAKGAVAAGEASAAAKSAAAKSAATSDGSTGAATKSSTGGAHAAAVGAKAKPATATGAKTAKKAAKPAAADRSAPLLRALERDRAVVLLFFNKRGLEDKAVRRAVTAVDRRDGRVVVKAVPVADVARYQAITRGAQVLQAPTALVIAPGKTVKPIVGYTTTAELDQAVGDALAAKRAKK